MKFLFFDTPYSSIITLPQPFTQQEFLMLFRHRTLNSIRVFVNQAFDFFNTVIYSVLTLNFKNFVFS